MANHEQKSLELLAEVDDLRHELRNAYANQALGQRGDQSRRIADLHQRIGISLKLADIHATHALRQAVQDAAGVPA